MSTENKRPAIYDLNRFTLFAPIEGVKQGDRQAFARLSWAIREGYPRISTFGINTKTKDKEFVSISMDPINFNAMLLDFIAILDKGEPEVHSIVNNAPITGKDGKYTGARTEAATFWYGIKKDGIAFVAMEDPTKNTNRYVFTFEGRPYLIFKRADGEVIEPKNISRLYAKATCVALQAIFNKEMANFEEYGARETTEPGSAKVQSKDEVSYTF